MNLDQAVARAHQAENDASIAEVELAKERSKAPAPVGLPGISTEELGNLKEVRTTLEADCIDQQKAVCFKEKNGRATYETIKPLETDCIDLQNEVRLQEKNGRAKDNTIHL